jgi:uncharacterized YccA/Bax inhibitor family protein
MYWFDDIGPLIENISVLMVVVYSLFVGKVSEVSFHMNVPQLIGDDISYALNPFIWFLLMWEAGIHTFPENFICPFYASLSWIHLLILLKINQAHSKVRSQVIKELRTLFRLFTSTFC